MIEYNSDDNLLWLFVWDYYSGADYPPSEKLMCKQLVKLILQTVPLKPPQKRTQRDEFVKTSYILHLGTNLVKGADPRISFFP